MYTASLESQTTSRHGWLPRVGLVAAIAVLHSPALLWVRLTWTHSPLGDVLLSLLTPVLIGGLLYVRRNLVTQLGDPDTRGHRMGLWLVAVATVMAVIALAINALPVLALTGAMSVHGYLLWTRGHARTRGLIVPVYLLVMMVPASDPALEFVSTAVQHASALGAGVLLSLTGLHVIVEGITIVADGTSNHVTEACSGLTTLGALLAFAAVLSYVRGFDWRRSALVAGALVVMAMGANVVRIAFISVLLVGWGEGVARGPLHDLSGYGSFVLSYVVLLWMVSALERLRPAGPIKVSATAMRRRGLNGE